MLELQKISQFVYLVSTEPAAYTCRVSSVKNDDDLELRIPRERSARAAKISQFVCFVSTEPAVYTCRVCSVENDDDLELRIPRERR